MADSSCRVAIGLAESRPGPLPVGESRASSHHIAVPRCPAVATFARDSRRGGSCRRDDRAIYAPAGRARRLRRTPRPGLVGGGRRRVGPRKDPSSARGAARPVRVGLRSEAVAAPRHPRTGARPGLRDTCACCLSGRRAESTRATSRRAYRTSAERSGPQGASVHRARSGSAGRRRRPDGMRHTLTLGYGARILCSNRISSDCERD